MTETVAERAGRAAGLDAGPMQASLLDWLLMCANDTVVPQLSECIGESIALLPVLGLESAGTTQFQIRTGQTLLSNSRFAWMSRKLLAVRR